MQSFKIPGEIEIPEPTSSMLLFGAGLLGLGLIRRRKQA
ncbi:PEP-CTERM sorting domain-containing protein [Nitrosomonas sp.]